MNFRAICTKMRC